MLHLHMTVDKILEKWPDAFSVFLKNKTKCPGCFMQPFCTLEDVAETYQLSADTLLAEIQSVADSLS